MCYNWVKNLTLNKMSNISIRIPDNLHNLLVKTADQEERSKSWIIKKALENYLEDLRDLKDGIAQLEDQLLNKEDLLDLEEVKKQNNL